VLFHNQSDRSRERPATDVVTPIDGPEYRPLFDTIRAHAINDSRDGMHAARAKGRATMSKQGAKCDAVTWEEKCAALENAFRMLRIQRSNKVTGIPYEFLIPGIGRQLMLMSFAAPHPKAESAKKELKYLASSVCRTIGVLERLPRAAIDALDIRESALRQLMTKLRILHAAANSATVTASGGAPVKVQPRKIACVVAQHYYALTGKKPTVPKKAGKATGPFPELLKSVYEILDVERDVSAPPKGVKRRVQPNKASSLSQAEWVSRNWKSIAAAFPAAGDGIK
jgi:hypothetical protein